MCAVFVSTVKMQERESEERENEEGVRILQQEMIAAGARRRDPQIIINTL